VDALERLRRLVDRDHRVAEGQQRVGDPARAGAELEDRGAFRDCLVDDVRIGGRMP
jgi:hypothetical protein